MASKGGASPPTVISPPDLYTVLCSGAQVLVFDVRNKEDYSKERIWSSVHLDLQKYPNVQAMARELFAARSADGDCPVTPRSHRRLFTNRAIYHVVVVDEDGADSRGMVAQLRQAGSHKPIQLLVGGYRMFNTLYPALCVGSSGQDQYLIDKCEKERTIYAPVEVLPHLFVGDMVVAQNFMACDILGIGSMVNAAAYVENFEPTVYKYLRCDQEELPFGDLVPLFDKVFKFIETAKGGGDKVLVYGAKEENGRAGMFVCAYLMRLKDWPLEKAFLEFKRVSRTFAPNVAILARLGEYETALAGTRHLEEVIKEQQEKAEGGGVKEGKLKVSEELKYLRRQQSRKFEEEQEEQAAVAAETNELEENLC